jgi:hypothetical protein
MAVKAIGRNYNYSSARPTCYPESGGMAISYQNLCSATRTYLPHQTTIQNYTTNKENYSRKEKG